MYTCWFQFLLIHLKIVISSSLPCRLSMCNLKYCFTEKLLKNCLVFSNANLWRKGRKQERSKEGKKGETALVTTEISAYKRKYEYQRPVILFNNYWFSHPKVFTSCVASFSGLEKGGFISDNIKRCCSLIYSSGSHVGAVWDIWQCIESFLVVTTEWMLLATVDKIWGCVTHPAMPRTAPHCKELPVPDVNSAKAKQPWQRVLGSQTSILSLVAQEGL